MPTAGTLIEYASAFGAIDSSEITQGKAGDAHLLRTIATNANRFAGTGQTILSLVFSVQNDIGTGIYAATGEFASEQWRSVFGGGLNAPRTPHLTVAEVKVVAKISTGATVLMQLSTSAVPFDPRAGASAENVLSMLGTGDWATYTLLTLRLGRTEVEPIAVSIRAGGGGFEGASGVTPSTGVVTHAYRGAIYDTTAVLSGAWAPFRYRMRITHGTTGERLCNDRTIIAATPISTEGDGVCFSVEPHLADGEIAAVTNHGSGATYTIGDQVSIQFASVVIAESDEY
jgi:hypothetical protein